MNKVILRGNVAFGPTLNETNTTGAHVANFNVATNRRYTDAQGNTFDEPQFHRCVAWGAQADFIGKYVATKMQVLVEGRLSNRKWTDKDGVERYSTEVVVEQFELLTSRSEAERLGIARDVPQASEASNAPATPEQVGERTLVEMASGAQTE